MIQGIQESSFSDGFAVGILTGQLKHQSPAVVKSWVSLNNLKNFKNVLRKYNYSITAISADPSDPDQVLLSAEKVNEGTDPQIILAFASGDKFMNGWEAGCLAGLLECQLNHIDEWVKIDNLDAIQQVIDHYGYEIKSMRIHPEYKKWTQLIAEKK